MHGTRRLPAVALSLALVAAAIALPQEPSLESLAAEARAQAGAPALGCVLQRAGEEPRVAVAGVRVAGEDAAVTVGDAWHWGSITKSMTATLVARLVEKGSVTWDDTVGELLFDRVEEMSPGLGDATFRHLLAHRAGQAANIPIERFAEFGQDPEDPALDRLRWVRIALAQEPVGAPGETYSYSNNGYVVAAAMLEAATGVAWEELMHEEVFGPLRLTGAGFGPPRGAAPRGHVANDDGTDRPVPPDADNPAALGPAGRVHMPLADLARYLSAHARRDPGFLGPETWEVLHEPPFAGFYAMGWVVAGETGRWHNGSNTMWYAEAAFDRETGTVAAVVVNDGNISEVKPAVSRLLGALLQGRREGGGPAPKDRDEATASDR